MNAPLGNCPSYIRWLGDRKEIERVTNVRNRIVVCRTAEMTSRVYVCKKFNDATSPLWIVNNHYAGFGVQLFRDTCVKMDSKFRLLALPPVIERTLFD
jgi:hypothetical protein